MAMTAMRGGEACFRMPAPLLGLLYELGSPGAKPLPIAKAMGVDTPEHRRWGVIEQVAVPDPDVTHNPDTVQAIRLTEWGTRLFSVLPMQRARDRRTLPPLIPVARLLAVCSPEDLEWLRQKTPLLKTSRGSLFEALGVIVPAARGDYWVPTTFLSHGFAQLDSGRDGPTLVNPFLNGDQSRFLRKALVGVAAHDAATDGRSLKPLGQDYMGLVTRAGDGSFFVPPSMRPFVRVAAVASGNPTALFEALPTTDQNWLVEECETDAAPVHTYLLNKMGWCYWKADRWNLTPMAKEQLEAWRQIVSAPLEGVSLPDPFDFSILDGVTQSDGPDDIFMVDIEPEHDTHAVDFGALDMMVQTTERVIGKHPALAAPYTPAPPPRIDNLYATTSAKEDDDFDIL